MLAGQHLRGRHEGALAAALRGIPDAGGGGEGLAAAHIALYQAVHGPAGTHVRHGLIHRAQLRACGGEGEGVVELPQVGGLEPYAVFGAPASPEHGERAGEDEELLKYQAAPGQLKGGEIRGEVHVLIGVAGLAELEAAGDGLRQGIRYGAGEQVQSLADAAHDGALAEAGDQAVYGHYAPGNAPGGGLTLKNRVGHLAPGALHTDTAVKDIVLTPAQLVFYI